MHKDYDEYLNGHARMIERDDERAAEGDRQYDAMKDRMAEAPEAKPCRFCGKRPSIEASGIGNSMAICRDCMAMVTGKDDESAIRNWNRWRA